MKSIVIHVLDSVCLANNRDPEATKLIEAAKAYGKVESLDSTIASEKARWQTEMNGLTAQHEEEVKGLKAKLAAIEERAITDEELELLRAIRKKTVSENNRYENEIKRRDEQLKRFIAEDEARRNQIKELFGF